jgi:glycosyltransferase involved in cell wall biosynthesis
MEYPDGLRLLVLAPYYPPHLGGVERFAWELNAHLTTRPEVAQVTVLTPQIPGSGSEREGDTHAVVRFPAMEVVSNYPLPAFWSPRLWRLVRTEIRRHDVFVCHTRFFLTSLLALALAGLKRRPLIHVEHGADFVQLPGSLTGAAASAYDRTVGRLVLRRASAVLAVSDAAAAFVRLLSGREAEVIRRGVEPDEVDAVQPSAELRGVLDGRPAVTFVGRLIESKGVADLLDAFASIEHQEAVLCIVGDGPARRALERKAGSRVLFLGPRPWSEVIAIMKASALVVNPSYTEGLPTAVLEAALSERAIVATDVGGTREAIEHGVSGVLLPARDVFALTSALDALLADAGLRRRLGERARAHVLARFKWDAAVERFLAVALALRQGNR